MARREPIRFNDEISQLGPQIRLNPIGNQIWAGFNIDAIARVFIDGNRGQGPEQTSAMAGVGGWTPVAAQISQPARGTN
jgi:hypothetical protein